MFRFTFTIYSLRLPPTAGNFKVGVIHYLSYFSDMYEFYHLAAKELRTFFIVDSKSLCNATMTFYANIVSIGINGYLSDRIWS